jgi:predicted NAD/FAD-dependent oxidoreductase
MSRIKNVAVVGAGMAGLACAAALVEAGIAVTLFDKGRRPGGRIATRRAEGVAFNHGAQYATARDAGFAALMAETAQAGGAAPWSAASRGADVAWVGTPGMSALPGHLAAGLTASGARLRTERHVGYLHAEDGLWRIRHLPSADIRPGMVTDEGGETDGNFGAVLLALPAPQAIALLSAIGHVHAAALAPVRFAPCWAVMAAFDEPIGAPDIARPKQGPLGWIARENARPGHKPGPDAWMLHATGAWSRANLERPAADVAAELLAAFAPDAPPPRILAAHRWRYALVETALDTPCLWDGASGIGVCGDFCLGPRVEAAWLSGTALASAVLSHN